MTEGDLVLTGSREFTYVVPREVGFWMTERDWARIRGRVNELKQHERQFYNVAWAAVGVVIGAVFAGLGWILPWASLNNAQKAQFAWIWVAIIFLALLGIGFAIGGFAAASITKKQGDQAASQIVDDMDAIHPALIHR